MMRSRLIACSFAFATAVARPCDQGKCQAEDGEDLALLQMHNMQKEETLAAATDESAPTCCCWWWNNVAAQDQTCSNCGNCVQSTDEAHCHGGESGSKWCAHGGSNSHAGNSLVQKEEPAEPAEPAPAEPEEPAPVPAAPVESAPAEPLVATTDESAAACCCWWWDNVAADDQTCDNCGNCVASTPEANCHGGESGSKWCTDGPVTPPSPSPSPATESCCCWWWDSVNEADRTCQNCGNCVESTPESQCHGGQSGSMWCPDGEQSGNSLVQKEEPAEPAPAEPVEPAEPAPVPAAPEESAPAEPLVATTDESAAACCCWWWDNVAADDQTCDNCGNCVASTPEANCHGGQSGSKWCTDGPVTPPSPSPSPVTESCCCWWWDSVNEADRTCQNCGNCVESTPESQCHGGQSGSMWCPDGDQ